MKINYHSGLPPRWLNKAKKLEAERERLLGVFAAKPDEYRQAKLGAFNKAARDAAANLEGLCCEVDERDRRFFIHWARSAIKRMAAHAQEFADFTE